MMSRLADAAKSLVPEVLQYPIKRLHKSHMNFFTYHRKQLVTGVRLGAALIGGVFGMSTIWFSAAAKTYLLSIATASISNSTACYVAVCGALFSAGFGAASFLSKQAFRAYYNHKFGVSNSEYVTLTKPELHDLQKKWKINSALANEVFHYLVKKIQKQKKSDNKKQVTPVLKVETSTKNVLQKFRKAGRPDGGEIISLIEYLAQEIERSKTRIKVVQKEMRYFPVMQELKEIKLEVSDVGPKKESPKEGSSDIHRTTSDFWHTKAQQGQNISQLMQDKIKRHERQIETAEGFIRRLHG